MLEGISYSPVLYTKNAELNALKNLRDELRPSMFPILSLRPLPHAHDFNHTLNKILEAKPGRFALDIDWSRYGKKHALTDPAQFDRLFLHNDGFQYYYEMIEGIKGAIPVIVRCNGDCQFLDSQLDQAAALGRGLVLRIERNNLHEMDHVIERVSSRIEDVAFLVDAGWANDILSAQPWTYSVIAKIQRQRDDAEIILASSSFPSSFSHMGKKGLSSNDDREMFRRMRAVTNADLTYGDWGSTRRSNEATPMKAVPRLDLAHSNEWLSYRRFGSESYMDIAKRLVLDESYMFTVDCWGKSLIQQLADGDAEAIKGTARATAARINMHLSVQASSGEAQNLPEETPYSDPF